MKLDKTTAAKAKELGISTRTFFNWQKAGAPVEKDATTILQWALAESKRTPDSAAMVRARLAVLRATAARIERDNARQSGKLLFAADVARQATDAENFYWSSLDRLVHSAQMLAGLSAAECQRKMAGIVNQIRDESRIQFAALGAKETVRAAVLESGKAAAERQIESEVARRCFEERCEQEYLTFKKWLADELKKRDAQEAAFKSGRVAAPPQ